MNLYWLLIKILEDNKQTCGIYRWVNKINGKSYVGNSIKVYVCQVIYL